MLVCIYSHRALQLQVIWQNYTALAKHFADNITSHFDHCRRIRCEMYFGPLSPFSIVVADLTNGVVADLTAVVAELTAVVPELDVADSTCRRVGCRRPDLSPT